MGIALTKEDAAEAILPTGPLPGENTGNDLVAGMTEDLGAVRPVPSDGDDGDCDSNGGCDGDRDGGNATTDSLVRDEGGALSGWNRCWSA